MSIDALLNSDPELVFVDIVASSTCSLRQIQPSFPEESGIAFSGLQR